jgi:threonine/homoserine/homoserine lactone efflux protein
MDVGLFLRGLVLGFAIAAAVGPISLLTIRRTLTDGLRAGLASGAGVATADAAYASVAAFGLTVISDVLVAQARLLGLVGGAFLVYLGLRTLTRPATPATAATGTASRGVVAAYVSILALTLANPATILSFAALFVGLGVIGQGGLPAALLVAGVFLGSMAWWAVLTFTVSQFRSRVTPSVLRAITIISGVLIAGFGVVAIVAANQHP